MPRRHRFSYFVPIVLLLTLASCVPLTADLYAVAPQAADVQPPTSTETLIPTATPLPTSPTSTAPAGPTAVSATPTPSSYPAIPSAMTLPVPKATPAGPLAVVQSATLNVSAGPGADHPVVAILKQGDMLSVTGRNSDASWLEITLPDGQRGWIAASLTQLNVPAATLVLARTIPTPPPELADRPKEMLVLVNKQRASYGLPALAWSLELARAAQAHAEDCALRNFGSHIGSDGAQLQTRLARAGYAATRSSEIWANARNGQQAFAMWWNEPPGNDPHRRNILAPQYKEIGVGVAAGGWGYYFIVDFGSR